jgi:hypothetical protein
VLRCMHIPAQSSWWAGNAASIVRVVNSVMRCVISRMVLLQYLHCSGIHPAVGVDCSLAACRLCSHCSPVLTDMHMFTGFWHQAASNLHGCVGVECTLKCRASCASVLGSAVILCRCLVQVLGALGICRACCQAVGLLNVGLLSL